MSEDVKKELFNLFFNNRDFKIIFGVDAGLLGECI